jgi:D-alanyl-D-alanine carboxypeptidase
MIKNRNWDGDFMLRKTLASSRLARVGVIGLVAFATGALLASGSAQAHRHRRHHAHHHHHAKGYHPEFSSIIVDGKSGAILEADHPDSLRHPASLAKVMTLYLLFKRLASGKMTLNTEMPISAHAAAQQPTKLDLRPGQTLRVEDAIKGIVTRSANDAAVVIAEDIGGTEENFAKMMTREAHALGMTRTVYLNASGLPNDKEVTTARDQSILARAIQDRFPQYYHFFSTRSFKFRGRTIRGHDHLLGSVAGVDGMKTGFTYASGFNLMTSMHRGNRFLIGIVMGGRTAASRDATMRKLLAENIRKAATVRTAAAITEHYGSGNAAHAATRTAAPSSPIALVSRAAAAVPPTRSRAEPAPLTSGVIDRPAAKLLGSTVPMQPVKVKTVHIRMPPVTLVTSAIAPGHAEVADASNTVVPRTGLPPQPAGYGTGHGLLGVLPASPSSTSWPGVAAPERQPAQADHRSDGIKSTDVHTGWMVQVGALDSVSEAQQRIAKARAHAHGLLSKANPFTEPVITKHDGKLIRARFAGLDRDRAEAVCRTLKRSDIPCIALHD